MYVFVLLSSFRRTLRSRRSSDLVVRLLHAVLFLNVVRLQVDVIVFPIQVAISKFCIYSVVFGSPPSQFRSQFHVDHPVVVPVLDHRQVLVAIVLIHFTMHTAR